MSLTAIVLHLGDNVATAVRPLERSEHVVYNLDGKPEKVILKQSIPFGHKFAIRYLYRGCFVIKYGETIGITTADILPGEHVHLHNVEGMRGRGDRQ